MRGAFLPVAMIVVVIRAHCFLVNKEVIILVLLLVGEPEEEPRRAVPAGITNYILPGVGGGAVAVTVAVAVLLAVAVAPLLAVVVGSRRRCPDDPYH